MIQKVLLPKLGQTVETAVIETWHKKEGDAVAKGDVLCEITTDKATLEVEAYHRGTLLKIVAQPGTELPINSLIAIIGDPGDEIPADLLAAGPALSAAPAAAKPAARAPAPAASAPAAPQAVAVPRPPAPPVPAAPVAVLSPAAAGRIFASPRARKLAGAEHVPVAVLKGSGPEGRIVEADVRAYLTRLDELKVTPLARKVACERNVDVVALAAAGKKVTREDVLAAQPVVRAAAPRPMPKAGRVELTAMRRIIAERMALSKREIPCYYLHMDVDMTGLMESRNRLNAKGSVKISVNDYILLACARAMAEFPDCNTFFDGDAIIFRGEINIGLAVALPQGLIVPVVKNLERKNLLEVAAESRSLVDKARGKRLMPDEYEGGGMTVSNLGQFGIKHFIPIVNPGESCILGLGIIEDRPVILQGGIHIRKMMTMALACDHRLIDGAVGARFLERVRNLLQSPAELER